MMKVGIDTQSICGCKTGIGYYTGGLIKQFTGVLEANFYYYKITTTKDFNTIQRIYW